MSPAYDVVLARRDRRPRVARICAAGYVPAGGSCCLASKVTSTGFAAAAGEATLSSEKRAEPIFHVPVGPLCCASGLIPTASGACCSPANVTTIRPMLLASLVNALRIGPSARRPPRS